MLTAEQPVSRRGVSKSLQAYRLQPAAVVLGQLHGWADSELLHESTALHHSRIDVRARVPALGPLRRRVDAGWRLAWVQS